jgi:hypothetical protein
MTPPVDDLGKRDPGRERDPDDEKGVRAAPAPRASGDVRPGLLVRRLLVRGRLALGARHHETRFEFPEEGRVLGERLGETRAQAAAAGGLIRQALEARRPLLDKRVALRHFFAGGASPVAIRQIRDASLRAPIVAAAPIPAYRPVHSSFRSTVFS